MQQEHFDQYWESLVPLQVLVDTLTNDNQTRMCITGSTSDKYGSYDDGVVTWL